MSNSRSLGLASGIGLCAATMIGSGVFLTAGYMAESLPPSWILVAWVLGVVLTVAGARAYGEIATMIPRSGGEYRYLSELFHPGLGLLAGWGTLLLGFAGPIAINARAAAEFFSHIVPTSNPALLATVLVIALTIGHAANLTASHWTQNLLVALKVVLLGGFLVFGLIVGDNSWPDWQPPQRHETSELLAIFMGNMLYVQYAFTGWNTSAYLAEEFSQPRRDVPKAMMMAAVIVGIYYLLMNWVFVANLTPDIATKVVDAHQLTLGHLVFAELLGAGAAKIMSAITVVVFVSAMSAMTMVGPRIYAAIAKDGFLPRQLRQVDGKPPIGAVILQGAIATALLHIHTIGEVLITSSAIIAMFSGATTAGLLLSRKLPRPATTAGKLAALLYASFSGWMLYHGFSGHPTIALWTAIIACAALGFAVIQARSGGHRKS